MSRLNDIDNFAGRVNFAASVIAGNRTTTRNFDNCFENYDGDEVLGVLVKRAKNNPKLAANMTRYFNSESLILAENLFKGMTSQQIANRAAKTRAARQAASDAYFAELARKNNS